MGRRKRDIVATLEKEPITPGVLKLVVDLIEELGELWINEGFEADCQKWAKEQREALLDKHGIVWRGTGVLG